MKLLNNNTRILRNSIYTLLYSVDKILQRKTSVFILCYHSIGSDNWHYTVSVEMFKKQINFLLEEGYTFISLSMLEEYMKKERFPDGKFVVLTIDDGYKNVTTIAPFLKEKKITPMLFLLGNTEKPNRKELDNTLSFLSKSEVLSLIQMGWEIGSHTQTHSNLSKLSNKSLLDEIVHSKIEIEKMIHKKVSTIAYPRGKYTNSVIQAVCKAGYTLGLSMDDGFVEKKTTLYALPRIGVDSSHTMNEFKMIYSPLNILFRKLVKKTFLKKYL